MRDGRYETSHFNLSIFLRFSGFELLTAVQFDRGRYIFIFADPERKARAEADRFFSPEGVLVDARGVLEAGKFLRTAIKEDEQRQRRDEETCSR